MNINSSILEVKGIGEKTAKLYQKLNINTVKDLIMNIPRDYLSYDEPTRIADIKEGVRVAIYAKVSSRVTSLKRGRYNISSFNVTDSSGYIPHHHNDVP